MKKTNVILGLIVLIVIVAAVSYLQTRPNLSVNPPGEPTTTLEQFLKANNPPSDVAEAYRFAQENPQQVLSQVKCYCGCLNQGHRHGRDCFVNNDGSFDLMGLNCGLCVQTALTAKQMLAQGKTVAEIADYVDQRWGDN